MDPSRTDLSALPKARALYDNQSEAPQELNFKSGDILYVVERDVAGYSGWWLCHSGQRLGIAPGNRLKLLTPDNIDARISVLKGSTSPSKETFLIDEQLSNYDVPLRLSVLSVGCSDGDPWKVRQEPDHNYGDSIYDKPVPASFLAAAAELNSPNRSSVLSMMSTGSSCMSDSAVSSVDASFVAYDVLPNRFTAASSDPFSSLRAAHSNHLRGKSVENQRDSYLDDYSVPRRGSDATPLTPVNSMMDLYDSPRSFPRSAGNVTKSETNSDQLYDVPHLLTLNQVQSVLLKPFDNLEVSTNIPLSAPLGSKASEDEEYNLSSTLECKQSPVPLASETVKAPNTVKTPVPSSLSPILAWQSDIQKHNSKLRSFILECGDADGFVQQQNVFHPHIKLCCLSLKTAVKELLDFCTESNIKSILSSNSCVLPPGKIKGHQQRKLIDCENFKIRVEMLRSALRQFEDRSNEFASSSRAKTSSFNQVKPSASQLKELLSMANVLPQITDLMVIDLCTRCDMKLPQDKGSDPSKPSSASECYPGSMHASPLQIKTPTSNDRRTSTSDQTSIRNRPLPPTPAFTTDDKICPITSVVAGTSPLQSKLSPHVGHRFSSPGLQNVSPNCSSQRLSCPMFSGLDANASHGGVLQKGSPLSARTSDVKGNTMDPLQPRCQLQKPPHLPPPHLYDDVELRDPPSDQRQLNPLLGSAESDALLVDFYASQIEGHMELVRKAASDFKRIMATVEPQDDGGLVRSFPHTPPRPLPSNPHSHRHQSPPRLQPPSQTPVAAHIPGQSLPTPKEFVLRSKFVILAAHKLVYVADAISRNLADASRYSDVALAANLLCDVLKMAVNATKEAALSHDSMRKRELMNSSVAEVEVRSDELCRVISKYRRSQQESQGNF